jgi:hypothetical protein
VSKEDRGAAAACLKAGRGAARASRSWQRRRHAWQPAGALVAVARAEEDSKEGEQARGRGRATRGVRPSRRWRRGGVRAAVGGADSRRQRGSRRAEQGR